MDIKIGDMVKLKKFYRNRVFKYPNGNIFYNTWSYSNEIGEVIRIDSDGAFKVRGLQVEWACKEMVEVLDDSIAYYLRRR